MGKKMGGAAASMDMTPMIDVVFQLMIFFIVTLKQEDILAHLDVNRPSGEKSPPKNDIQLLEIIVYNKGFVMNGTPLNVADLEARLGKLASISKTVSVVIKCTADSPHAFLMQLLDICAKSELTNLSVFSM
jgi:biopolymer transport protein ExbD